MKRIFVMLLPAAILLCGCSDAGEISDTETKAETGQTSADSTEKNSAEPISTDSNETEQITESDSEAILLLTINDTKLSATLENNSSVDALKEKLSEGNITIKAKEYGGFEKVGSLGFSLPKNDTQYETDFGDIMLYQGNQITLFYGQNSWSYTKIGHVDDLTQEELKNILGSGDVNITLSLK